MRNGNWVVVAQEKENTVTVLFDGPDKRKARKAAADALASGKKAVTAFKALQVANLSPESLERVLPNTAF